MTIFAVHQTSDGTLVSVGTIVASPLPAGLTAVALSTADGNALRDGTGRWDTATRAVVLLPPDVTIANEVTLIDRAGAALTANASFLAITTPTATQVREQTILLTKECNAILRLLLAQLGDRSKLNDVTGAS